MDYYELGQRIRKARKERNLSQENLAEAVGISVTHMSHIETGNTKLSMEVFYSIVKALDINSDKLLFGEDIQTDITIIENIISTLQTCTYNQLCVLSDIINATKTSLEKNYDK